MVTEINDLFHVEPVSFVTFSSSTIWGEKIYWEHTFSLIDIYVFLNMQILFIPYFIFLDNQPCLKKPTQIFCSWTFFKKPFE